MTGADIVGISIHSSRFSTDSVLMALGKVAEDPAPAVEVSLRLSAVGMSVVRICFKRMNVQICRETKSFTHPIAIHINIFFDPQFFLVPVVYNVDFTLVLVPFTMFMLSLSVGIIAVVMFASFFVFSIWVFVSVLFVFAGMFFGRVLFAHLGVVEVNQVLMNAEFIIKGPGLIRNKLHCRDSSDRAKFESDHNGHRPKRFQRSHYHNSRPC